MPQPTKQQRENALERAKQIRLRRSKRPSADDICKDLRKYGGDGVIHRKDYSNGKVHLDMSQTGHQAAVVLSEMYKDERKLEIEHGEEANAKRDHATLRAEAEERREIKRRRLQRARRGRKTIVSFHGIGR